MINISTISKYIITIIWILLLQITLLDNLIISQYVYIPAYLLFIISLPKNNKSIKAMTIAFIYGMFIDYYSGTNGAITAALVFTTAIRSFIICKIVVNDPNMYNKSLKIKNFSLKNYVIYVLIMVLIFNISLVLIENYATISFVYVVKKILLSTIFTVPIILLFQYIVYDNFD